MKKFVLAAMTLSGAAWLATPASAASFSFSAGNPDGRLGALSRPESAGEVETETADDFILSDTTVIKSATISGLLTSGATPADIGNVEVEVYHGGDHVRAGIEARRRGMRFCLGLLGMPMSIRFMAAIFA